MSFFSLPWNVILFFFKSSISSDFLSQCVLAGFDFLVLLIYIWDYRCRPSRWQTETTAFTPSLSLESSEWNVCIYPQFVFQNPSPWYAAVRRLNSGKVITLWGWSHEQIVRVFFHTPPNLLWPYAWGHENKFLFIWYLVSVPVS